MREPWVRFLAWSELVSGAAGFVNYLWVLALYPGWILTWSTLLALTFFGANVVAGYRLLLGRGSGARFSFVLQIVQILVFNVGVAYIAHAGLHVTFAVASTGAGFFAGPSARFAAVSTTVGGLNAGGIGFALDTGWWLKPIEQAHFAIGINLVALFFTMRLWRSPLLMQEDPLPPPATLRAPRNYRRWALPVFAAVVVVIAIWVALGGYERLTKPNPRWALPNGDTVEILIYNNEYSASYRPHDKTFQARHYLWVQFRSDLTDRARDHGAAVAVAQVLCPHADSIDVHRVLVQPSRTRLWGLYTYSRTYWFEAGPAGRCEETAAR